MGTRGSIRTHHITSAPGYLFRAGSLAGVSPRFIRYVREQVHTNGMESFWATLKRAHKGVYHKMSRKHMDRYVREFAGRHNVRECDTVDQVETMVSGMEGKRPKYRTLKADNGLPSGARP